MYGLFVAARRPYFDRKISTMDLENPRWQSEFTKKHNPPGWI
jgi:hypothetical protein